MKNLYGLFFLTCLISALFFTGCSSIEVSQDYQPQSDFTHLKTYAWQSDMQEKTGDIRIDSPLVDNRIRKAIEQTLSNRHFLKAANTPPDFHIRYLYTISEKTISRPVHTGVGYGYGHYGRYGTIGIYTGQQIENYDEGLLIIDFLKPDSEIILWRATSTRVVETHATPSEMHQDTQEAVEKMLAQFPPEN